MPKRIVDEYSNRSDLSPAQKWTLRHPDKAKATYRRNNKQRYDNLTDDERSVKMAAERERWHKLTVTEKRSRWLRHRYKLSWSQYEEMYEAQSGKCFLCSEEISILSNEHSRNIACIDHNHDTGKIRKLICNHCNRALGLVKERIDVLKNMIIYLETHNE